jgi:hypothetical protein
MNIIKKNRNLLVCISVIVSLLSSCIPVMDSVSLVGFKNCTNDTLVIGGSDYDNIDSVWFFKDVNKLSKEPLLTSIDSIILSDIKHYCDTTINQEEIFEKNKEGMITYPDSLFFVNEYCLFDQYFFFLIKLEDAKNHSWDEIRAKKLYKKWKVVRKKYGGYDRNIRYSE